MTRIGLNAHLFSLNQTYRSAGLSRYIERLLVHLPLVDPASDYVGFFGKHSLDTQGSPPQDAHLGGWTQHFSAWPTERPPLRIAWEQLAQPAAARREKIDLLHAPVCVGPLASRCPQIVTIHDLSFYIYPDLFQRFNRTYLQTMTRLTAHKAEAIIADSSSTRDDIVRILGIPASKVKVIPAGVGEEMHPVTDTGALAALRKRHQLPDKIILYLGTIEPRKNIVALLRAFAKLQDPTHTLVVAGGRGWYFDQVFATVEKLGLGGRVIFPGYVAEHELPLWYNAADLFVYPSLYEGFGLPPLEAMACGTPVIVSRASSLPEVVGDAGAIVDPHDIDQLAETITHILGDAQLRMRMRTLGLKRATQLSWIATAQRTSEAYHTILGTQRHGHEENP